MLRIPWSTDIGLAHPQICVTLIPLIACSSSPTISDAKRLGGHRSQEASLPSWKLSHLFYIGVLTFICSKTYTVWSEYWLELKAWTVGRWGICFLTLHVTPLTTAFWTQMNSCPEIAQPCPVNQSTVHLWSMLKKEQVLVYQEAVRQVLNYLPTRRQISLHFTEKNILYWLTNINQCLCKWQEQSLLLIVTSIAAVIALYNKKRPVKLLNCLILLITTIVCGIIMVHFDKSQS